MKSVKRFKISELTMERSLEAFKRRLVDIPNTVAWYFLPAARENRVQLKMYQNKHKGQKCFIMANGPSLNKTDLTLLKNEVTFGLNRIYLLFDKMTFQPTYYVCINGLVLEQFSNDICRLKMPKFINWTWRQLFQIDDPNLLFLKDKLALNSFFEHDLTKPYTGGGTVTFAALQIAYYMGFREVILIGLDHNYIEKGIPSKTEIRSVDNDQNHFHPDYFPKGSKWQLPDLLASELAYATARKAFEEDGRKIFDATPNGKCQVFEKVEFSSLFG